MFPSAGAWSATHGAAVVAHPFDNSPLLYYTYSRANRELRIKKRENRPLRTLNATCKTVSIPTRCKNARSFTIHYSLFTILNSRFIRWPIAQHECFGYNVAIPFAVAMAHVRLAPAIRPYNRQCMYWSLLWQLPQPLNRKRRSIWCKPDML